ncbi:hypothetical protein PHYBOEH_007811 [Phytophthora boehmeriae]|uniref:Uncharacterized protein n=1 Tax=Phytophthora boehmeriae TaxID=109152 RepID=A0A8T1X0L6_9STRA|nr:hypothetical protein PHYBOEH_007811 [Phytophthora boehmeriae]
MVEDEEDEVEDDSDDDTEDEERNGLTKMMSLDDMIRAVSYKQLDDVAEKVAGTKGMRKFLDERVKQSLLRIAVDKVTPKALDQQLNVAAKIKGVPEDQLTFIPEYLLSQAYKELWVKRGYKLYD